MITIISKNKFIKILSDKKSNEIKVTQRHVIKFYQNFTQV